jgi:hypothetical protein
MSQAIKPAASPLEGVRIKIERAKGHVMHLHSEVMAFHNRKPYQLIAKEDPKTEKRVYSVKINECIPRSFSGIIGDTIHNLRAALDQLAWQLVIVNTQQPRRRTGFPIGSDRKEFEADAEGKVKGIAKPAIRLIHRLKPYRGGCEPFWLRARPVSVFRQLADERSA